MAEIYAAMKKREYVKFCIRFNDKSASPNVKLCTSYAGSISHILYVFLVDILLMPFWGSEKV